MRPGPVLALIAAVAALPAAAAELLGTHVWEPGFDGAGGWSALWLEPEGEGFVVLSDRGTWARGVLERDAGGAIAGVEVEARGPLLRAGGARPSWYESDAESIAYADGAFWVGFEGARARSRVERYDDLAEPPSRTAPFGDVARFESNAGLEALASDAEGTLWAIPEEPPRGTDGFQVYRLAGGAWERAFTIPKVGRFLVTGADIGPDGRLYVLERAFALVGFRSRVRSFDLAGGDGRVELETRLRRHDNLEGIAVRRDASGRLRLTMISDDNQRRLVQRTEWVEYLLEGEEAGG